VESWKCHENKIFNRLTFCRAWSYLRIYMNPVH
jgi:hypothetical protein